MTSKGPLARAVLLALVTSSHLACDDAPPAPPEAPELRIGALGESGDPHLLTVAASGLTNGGPYDAVYYQNRYVRLTLPANHDGLRVSVKSAQDLYFTLHKDTYNGSSLGSVSNRKVATVFVPKDTLGAATYVFVEVYTYNPGGSTFEVQAEPIFARTLAWDPGTTVAGTSSASKPAGAWGDHLFKITSQTSAYGAWRSTVKSSAGEVDLFVQQNTVPDQIYASYTSAKTGADGIVLAGPEFAAQQLWYLRVIDREATSDWTVLSGDIVVTDFGALTANASSPGSLEVGPEGAAWFKTTIPVDTLAWRITAQGATIYVADDSAPVPRRANQWDIKEEDATLQVPSYVRNTQFLVALEPRTPAASVTVDSRSQPVRAIGNLFAFEETFQADAAWTTYRVDVPISQIAWQVTVTPTDGGEADLYVRRGAVAGYYYNDGFSEIPGAVTDSVTQVPPELSNATFYVSVRSTVGKSFRITSGNPEITLIPYINGAGIQNDQPNLVGWRYYRIDNDASQLGTLGWLLELLAPTTGTPAPAGTEIALRRGGVPGRVRYRANGNTYVSEYNNVLYSSTVGFLQRPNHQADFWYIGIYNPTQALNDFVLRTSAIDAENLALNGGTVTVANQPSGTWRFFRVVVPEASVAPGFLGWDLQIDNVTSGKPRMIIRRSLLSDTWGTDYMFTYQTYWNLNQQWAPDNDVTNRPYLPYTVEAPNEARYGQRIHVGLNGMLEPGTYYVGVSDLYTTPTAGVPLSYRFTSRGIGIGDAPATMGGQPWVKQVQDVAFTNGTAEITNLAPRETEFYRVAVPADATSWQLELDTTVGEALLGVRKGNLPGAHMGSATESGPGLRRQKDGDELYIRYPDYNQSTLSGGYYYVSVSSEGQNPHSTSHIGEGGINATLRSVGQVPIVATEEVDLGGPVVLDDGTSELAYGHHRAYRFTITNPDIKNVEVRLSSLAGQGSFSVTRDPGFPGPYDQTYQASEGGRSVIAYGTGLDTIIGPNGGSPIGTYTVVVVARTFSPPYPQPSQNIPARFTLEIEAQGTQTLAFNGGDPLTVTNQPSGTWRYFKVEVPEATPDNKLLGWDLRLVNIQSGDPRMVIRRGSTTDSLSTSYMMPYYATWDTDMQWAPAYDLTQRPYVPWTEATQNQSFYGKSFQVGFGGPLSPGTYYVGVNDNTSTSGGTPLAYQIVSRGIGEDVGWDIPVTPLAFDGTATLTNLPSREFAYYRVDVPAGAKSWEVELAPATGADEGSFVIRRGRLPHSESGGDTGSLGARRNRVGSDLFYKYPDYNSFSVTSGAYYIAVASEGQSPHSASHVGADPASFELRSKGEIEVDTVSDPVISGQPARWNAQALPTGAHKSYRFTVPADTKSIEVRLTTTSGYPYASVSGPSGGFPSPYGQSYNASEGGTSPVLYGTGILSLQNPPAGDYTVVVTTQNHPQTNLPIDASYDLEARALGDSPLAFNGGSLRIEDQEAGTKRFFLVTVPDAPGLLGWDLRLRNVEGNARMVIRRGTQQPSSMTTDPGYYTYLYQLPSWADNQQWAPDYDMTNRYYDPYNPQGQTNSHGRIVTMGLGSPLSPGSYIVGVWDPNNQTALKYDIVSRGIGIGDDPNGNPWLMQVEDLAWDGGVAQITGLAPREVKFFRVQVPDGLSSWGAEIEPAGAGEAMMAVNHGALPNSSASAGNTDITGTNRQGSRRQKAGGELFYRYPARGQKTIEGGTYYIAVASEGASPYSDGYLGTGPVDVTVRTTGEVEYGHADEEVLVAGAPVRFNAQVLEYGAEIRYRVRVPDDIESYSVRLENTLGAPHYAAGVYPFFDSGTPALYDSYYDSGERGWDPLVGNITNSYEFTNRSGDLEIIVHAGRTPQGVAADAQFDLVIEATPITTLAYDGGSATASLKDGEVRFYKIEVPVECGDEPPPGWVVSVVPTNAVTMYTDIRRGRLPGDPKSDGASFTMNMTNTRETIVAPPHFRAGTWYVAVRANSLTQFTITSRPIVAERTWTMPRADEQPSLPNVPNSGLAFVDTGYLPDGQLYDHPNGGGAGVDLGKDEHRFYKVVVPEGNGGFVKTRLEAISGNPDMFMRIGAAPTLNHDEGGPLYYRNLVTWRDEQANTSFGHFASADTKYGHELKPGTYWFMVKAINSQVRYRLIMSVAEITEWDITSGNVSNATLAAGDMRFYHVRTPAMSVTAANSTPLEWKLTLAQTQGDIAVFIRERGLAGGSNAPTATYPEYEIRDWYTDRSGYTSLYYYNQASPPPHYRIEEDGTKTFTLGMFAPGVDYYLGVYARGPQDGKYNFSTSVGEARLALTGELDYGVLATPVFGNSASGTLAPGETRYYRVSVPEDAARWRHRYTAGEGVNMRLALDTLPPATYGDWYTTGNQTDVWHEQPLYYPGGYIYNHPWRPGRDYYFVVQNTSASPRDFALLLDGRDKTADDDLVGNVETGDGLPDWWEYNWFGGLYYDGNGDYDNDQLSNAAELSAGTNPTDWDSDDDTLADGYEVATGANPLLGDSDSDDVCDGNDSDPTDPNETGTVIRLRLNEYEGGLYGRGFGTNQHRTKLVAVFETYSGAASKQHWIHIKPWGIETATEVKVLLNGTQIGTLPVGGANVYSRPVMFAVETNTLAGSGRDNRLELVQTGAAETAVWGVADMGLFTYGASFGYDATAAYDQKHPDGFIMYAPSFGASRVLEVRAFDVDQPGEIAVTVDGTPLFELPAGGAGAHNAWTPYYQMPLNPADFQAGVNLIDVKPGAGSDGNWQIRLVESRTFYAYFGTGYGTEGEHDQQQIALLLPRTSVNRQLEMYVYTEQGGKVAFAGSHPPDGGESPWPGSSSPAVYRYWCSDKDAVDWGEVTRVPAEPATSPYFFVQLMSWGPELDLDGDTHGNCSDAFPRNVSEWEDVDGDRIGDNWERSWFEGLTLANGTTDYDGDGKPDLQEFRDLTNPVCADLDGDGAEGVTALCLTGNDCDDTDPDIGPGADDGDCDGVPTAIDCDDGNPNVMTTNVGDADCDGVPTASDCDDGDATVPALDADCDGVATAADCDDADETLGAIANDGDCDGVPKASDCNDASAAIGSSANDTDCDGVANATDCKPTDPNAPKNDADCDGASTASDCDDANPAVQVCQPCVDADGDGHGARSAECPNGDDCNDASNTSTTLGIDADCDGITTARDCNDGNPQIVQTRDGDQDCDGVPTASDCDDADPGNTTTSAGDADCDGVPSEVDCDDASAAVVSTSTLDKDCDGVPTAVDCNDANAAIRNTSTLDKDCDGVATAIDCNDGSAAITNTSTLDKDCDLVASSLDCNDADPANTRSRAGDRDCDGIDSALDCDDNNPRMTATRVGDADCDGVGTALDCDDSDPAIRNSNAADVDCDLVPTSADCDDTKASVKNTRTNDADCDLVPTANDCDDADASVTEVRTGDQDCDDVPSAVDCDDSDPTEVRSRVGDADCDGVSSDVDCDDADAAVTRSNVGDADCDGVSSDVDCDDGDARETGTNFGDLDCDGVASGLDCDDRDAAKRATSLNDADCDGVSTPIDCDDGDLAERRSKLNDADCDDVRADLDCDDHDPGVTRTRTGDEDCDGVPSAEDCDDASALVATRRAEDRDCDGVPDGIDCAPDDALIATSTGNDGDCDGVPSALDCDDEDAEDLRSNALDADCDGVPSALDCDDGDASKTVSTALDGDCDGVLAALDCDDTDASDTAVCGECTDGDGDGVFGVSERCAKGDDCDDADPASTTRVEDGDCDGVAGALDCDDGDAAVGALADDGDCDGVPASVDCDDADAGEAAVCHEWCVDADGDGHDAQSAWCAAGDDCDDGDAGSTTKGEDGDCDGVVGASDCDDGDAHAGARSLDADCDGVDDAADVCPSLADDQRDEDDDGVGDACDVCPMVGDADQADTDGDGVGDACQDGDGDGIPDEDDNCVDVANRDQIDLDADGIGDRCDAPVKYADDAGCAGGLGAWGAGALLLLFVLRRRAWLVVLLAAMGLGACGDDAPRRPLGAQCESESECLTGLCGGGFCLDPEADSDGDGLVNAFEVQELGTNPLAADTDGDGMDDGAELVGLANQDGDGDGKADAIESATDDSDADCIPDQFDAEDGVDNSDTTPAYEALCPQHGVCADGPMSVTCSPGVKPYCDVSEVVGFESTEVSCDGLDNDCDGETDEDLPEGACAPVLTSIAIAPGEVDVWATRTVTLTVTGHYDDGSVGLLDATTLEWQSSDGAAVVEGGVVTGVSEGAAEVTGSREGLSAVVEVRVHGACAPGEELIEGACQGVTGDLVGHYRLDGDGRDASGYFAHGSVFGAEPVADRFGVAGRAMAFCEVGDRVEVRESMHPLGEVTATYTFWVKAREGAVGEQAVLSAGQLLPGRRSSVILEGEEACVGYRAQGHDAASAGLCAAPARWSFVAVVKDGRAVRMHVNGQQVGEAETSVGQDVTSRLLQIGLAAVGADGVVRDQLCGALDDVRIYSRALAAEEIETLYRLGGWADVGTEANPGRACDHVLASGGAAGDGRYWIDPDGDGPGVGFQAWCDMSGGGWTLAWVYGFTRYEAFVSAGNAVTPRPSWAASGADVPISESAPAGPEAPGAIAWSAWRHLGEAMRVTSNVNQHLECRPAVVTGGTDVSGGSLAKGTSGPVTCEVIGEVVDICQGVAPVGLGWGPYGPSLAGDENYYYWDGSTTANWPTHDPCGTERPNHVDGVTSPMGALWLRH